MSSDAQKLPPKVLISCFIASMLEMYDFAIFGFLSVVIHKNYLSFLDADQALFVSYAFFGVGYVFRPLGALIFGYVGDKLGRKKSLVTSVSIMGFASLTMFLLPPFETIGMLACYIIVAVRIFQGISVGGEFTGAIVFAVEHSKKSYAGFVAAIVPAGASSGILLANFVTNLLNNQELPDYSWRFAFLLGFLLALIGFFIRRQLSDTPVFLSAKRSKVPLFEGLKHYKIEAFSTLCLAAASGAIVYFGGVYLFRLLQTVNPISDFKFVPILVNGIVVIFLPIFGYLSDLVTRRIFIAASSLCMSAFLFLFLKPILYADNMNIIILGVTIYALLNAALTSGINIFVVELFPAKCRMSMSGLFYSLGMGFVGGTVPMLSTYLIKNYDSGASYIAYYLSFLCFIACLNIGILRLKSK